jgi:cysteine-rich repeat protein
MRSWALFASIAMASCGGDVGAVPLALNDPLDLIDDVEGPLRLFVLPADTHACEATTGAVSPMVPDVAEGMFEEAIADLSLEVSASRAQAELEVPSGDYVVLVRGKGTDQVTGVRDVFIATGCANASIASGATLEIGITLIPIVGMGMCGDGVFSPDEQCEDSNTAAGDGCSAACRTETISINTTTAATQENASVGGASARRWLFAYETGATETLIRILEADGSTVEVPGLLMTDSTLVSSLPGALPGVHIAPAAAVAPSGRLALAFRHVAGGARIRVAFYDENRTAEGESVIVKDGLEAASEPDVSLAFAPDGTLMLVFEDATSATGLSGQIFGPDSVVPIAPEPFVVGAGALGGTEPVITAANDHFVVAFAAGDDVFMQRFGTDGAARDANAVGVLDDAAGVQDQASIAALADGRTLVAWREAGAEGDGTGSSIRARAFNAIGGPAGDAFVLNTTTAGDQSDPQVAPGAEGFAVVFASGNSIRARILTADATPIPNREQPPTIADFELSANGTQPTASRGGVGNAMLMSAWTENGDIRARMYPLP